MKPKDLKCPYSWDERHVKYDDQVLFVPDYYEDFSPEDFPGWEKIFGNDQSVYVEFCSGNGTWIAEKAKEFPQINWVAVEKRFDRVRKIWSKAKNEGLSNLLVVSGEAWVTSQNLFPQGSVKQAFINFPDPWPKKRHAKHRIVQTPFAEELRRLVCPGGVVTIVTDDPTYSGQIQEVMGELEGAQSLHPRGYTNEFKGYGTSYFDALWRGLGREIRYHQYCMLGIPAGVA